MKINRGIKAKLAFDKEAFINDAKNGMSNNKLSQKYRMAHSTVAKRLREFGILPEPEKKKTMESVIQVSEPLTVEKIAKKRLIPQSLKELQQKELDEKIKLTQQINRMSKKQTESYLDEEVY